MVAIQDYSATLEKLEEYEENRPLREAYKILERRFHSRDRNCENLDSRLQDEIRERIKENSRWMLNEDELKNIPIKHGGKSKTPKPIDPNHYNKMIQEILNSPLKYQDKIPGLMKRFYNLRDSTHQQSLLVINNVSAQITN